MPAPRGETVTWADNRGFLDQPADPDTGLTYDGARAYDPVTAQFISPDPVLNTSDPQDLDPYDYAEDNPVTGSDPSGDFMTRGGGGAPSPTPAPSGSGSGDSGGSGGGGYGSGSGSGCGYVGLSCYQDILGSYESGPAPVLNSAVVSPPPAPPRPKPVTLPPSVISSTCNGTMFRLGACPSERGAVGTTPAQVKQAMEGAGMVFLSAIPVADIAEALLGGGEAAAGGGGLLSRLFSPNTIAYAGSDSSEARGGVYTLRDEVGNVVRTGRISNLATRALAHANDPVLGQFSFQIEYRTDVYAEQRGLGQMLYEQYSGAQSANGGYNMIRAISPLNPRGPGYVQAAQAYLQRLTGG